MKKHKEKVHQAGICIPAQRSAIWKEHHITIHSKHCLADFAISDLRASSLLSQVLQANQT